LALVVVSDAIAGYHWLVLRADARRLAVASEPQDEPGARRVHLELAAPDAAALERALAALRATGVQVTVR
jgi:hypothetical protein